MKLVKETKSRAPWALRWGLAVSAGAATVQALLPSRWQLFCPWMRWAEIPCPTCGATRCVAAVLKGSWGEAFYIQPLFFIVAGLFCAFWLWCELSILFGFSIYWIQFERRLERFIAGGAGGVLILLNWLYVIAHCSA